MVPTIESLIIPRKSQKDLADNRKFLRGGSSHGAHLPFL